MGNRSFLYVLPAADQQEDFRGQQVAEANNHFPSLWRVLLADASVGPAVDVQRVFFDGRTAGLQVTAAAAMERLAELAAFYAEHPMRTRQPLLAQQFDALQHYLSDAIEACGGKDFARLSADADELFALEGGDPDAFIAALALDCGSVWASIRDGIAAGHHASVDRLLGLDEPGYGGFAQWTAWSIAFGFSGISHEYFFLCDTPRPESFANWCASQQDASASDAPESADEQYLFESVRAFCSDGHWGLVWISNEGERQIIAVPSFEAIESSGCGDRVWARLGGKLGLLRVGPGGSEWLLAPEVSGIDAASEFELGYAVVTCGERDGLLDADGRWVLAPAFETLWVPENGCLIFRAGDQEGMVDVEGKIRIPARFDSLSACSAQGLMIAETAGKFGVVDRDGEWILSPDYDAISSNSTEFGYWLRMGDRVGRANAEGRLCLEPDWDDIRLLVDGRLFAASRDGAISLFDDHGVRCNDLRFDEVDYRYLNELHLPADEGVPISSGPLDVFVRQGRKRGLVDTAGRLRVPIDYARCENLELSRPNPGGAPDSEVAVARRGKRNRLKWGVYDTALAREIVPCEYEVLFRVRTADGNETYVVGRRNDAPESPLKVGMLRADGSRLVPLDYAWLYQNYDLAEADWVREIVRQRIAEQWDDGLPVEACEMESGAIVWLHASGRAEAHANYLRGRAERGDLTAALRLARDLETGRGVEADAGQARVWYARAAGASLSSPDAVPRRGGWMGRIGVASRTPAPGWIPPPEATAEGLSEAMGELAACLIDGIGGPAQPQEGIEWMRQAVERGPDASGRWACHLGYLQAEGIGCEADWGKARSLYELAAHRGNGTAWHNLGLIHQFGSGLPDGPDLDEALRCFERSQASGHEDCRYHQGDVRWRQGLTLNGAEREARFREALYHLQPVCVDPETEHAREAAVVVAEIQLDASVATHDRVAAETLLRRYAALGDDACTALLGARFST